MKLLNNIQRAIFKSLSLENYLRLLQRSYFMLYNLQVLRLSSNYKYHYFVRRLIKKGDTVIDIGANLGYYSMLYARWIGPKGRLYSVEPIAIYNKIFNETAAKFSNITLYPYALGVEEKEIEMVSSPNTGYLRTGLPHVYDPKVDGEASQQEFTFKAQMKIPAKLFGDINKIDYLKCDIEGFEYIVLSNMKDIIARTRPKVQVEVWSQNEADVLSLFKELGYRAFKLSGGALAECGEQTKDNDGDYIFIHCDDDYLKTNA